MIWFGLIAIVATILGIAFGGCTKLGFSAHSEAWEWVCIIVAVIFVILFVGNLVYVGCTPEGYVEQEVYEVTEDGVVKTADTTYYQDEKGDWYVKVYENESCESWYLMCYKNWTHFFYQHKYKKVDAPVFENGNFIINNAEEDASPGKHCTKCGNELELNDNFCSDCGTNVKKKG